MKRNTLQKLEAIAGTEFAFEGQEYAYDGAGEFDFDGNVGSIAGFAQELAGSRPFMLTIENTHPTTKNIVICPGMYSTIAQLTNAGVTGVDGILTDGLILDTPTVGRVSATAGSSNQSIFTLLEFVKRNPSRITHISMVSNKEAQFEQVMNLQVVDPFAKNGSFPLLLTDFRPPNQLQKDKIVMNLLASDKVIDMNDQNVVILPVEGASKLSIVFRIGGILNPAKQLKTAARVAHGNIRRQNPHVYMKG